MGVLLRCIGFMWLGFCNCNLELRRLSWSWKIRSLITNCTLPFLGTFSYIVMHDKAYLCWSSQGSSRYLQAKWLFQNYTLEHRVIPNNLLIYHSWLSICMDSNRFINYLTTIWDLTSSDLKSTWTHPFDCWAIQFADISSATQKVLASWILSTVAHLVSFPSKGL